MNDRPTELGPGSDYVVRYGYGTWGRQDELTFGVGPATSKVPYAYVKNSELLRSRVPTNGPAFRPAYEPARDLISWVTNRFGGTVVSPGSTPACAMPSGIFTTASPVWPAMTRAGWNATRRTGSSSGSGVPISANQEASGAHAHWRLRR